MQKITKKINLQEHQNIYASNVLILMTKDLFKLISSKCSKVFINIFSYVYWIFFKKMRPTKSCTNRSGVFYGVCCCKMLLDIFHAGTDLYVSVFPAENVFWCSAHVHCSVRMNLKWMYAVNKVHLYWSYWQYAQFNACSLVNIIYIKISSFN